MKDNGFYAAMKTDKGIQTIYIDEESFRAQQARANEERRRKESKLQQHRQDADLARRRRSAIKLLKQEGKLIGMGAILYWGYTAGLVALAFMVPVLVAFQTVICFRAGRWWGRRDQATR